MVRSKVGGNPAPATKAIRGQKEFLQEGRHGFGKRAWRRGNGHRQRLASCQAVSGDAHDLQGAPRAFERILRKNGVAKSRLYQALDGMIPGNDLLSSKNYGNNNVTSSVSTCDGAARIRGTGYGRTESRSTILRFPA